MKEKFLIQFGVDRIDECLRIAQKCETVQQVVHYLKRLKEEIKMED